MSSPTNTVFITNPTHHHTHAPLLSPSTPPIVLIAEAMMVVSGGYRWLVVAVFGSDEQEQSKPITPNIRRQYRKGRRSERSRSMSGSPEHTNVFSRIKQGRSRSPKHRLEDKGRRNGGVFDRLGGKERNVFVCSERCYQSSRSERTNSISRKHHQEYPRKSSELSKSEDSGGGH
ncbi:hypothetical protein Tco_0525453 [Tanacetum coccineum]